VALHLLELGVKKGNLQNVIVVTCQQGARVAVNGDAVADVKGVLDKDENDGLSIRVSA
jgi:hypothetical protein